MSSPKPPPFPSAQGNAPSPRLAPHVQRAVAAVQPKPAQAVPSRNPAPHVQRAVAAVQAKAQPAPAARPLAPHVQAALQKEAPAAVQRASPAGTGVRQPAPHVQAAQAALGRNLQAKPQPPGPRPPASHVQSAVRPVGPDLRPIQAAQSRHPASRLRPAAIQRMEEDPSGRGFEKAITNVRSNLLIDGPGNLNTSSQEARKRFNLADALLDKLREYRDIHSTILDALSRIHFKISTDVSVKSYVNHEETPFEKAKEIGDFKKTGEIVAKKNKLTELANAVYFDFVLKKTGGGSCDHCSAGVFFQLIDTDPEAKVEIMKYMPASDESVKITSPLDLPYHRATMVQQDENHHVLDAWWPGGGRVDKSVHVDQYPEAQTVVKWKPKYKEFVAALRLELEHHYQAVKHDLPEELSDKVGAVWTISNN